MSTDAEQPQSLLSRVALEGRPIAHPDSVVEEGNARFTILTSRLIRMEWSETGKFEDRSSYAFPTRLAPPPTYTVRRECERLTIDTGVLRLRYLQAGGRFSPTNLSIAYELEGQHRVWTPSTPDLENLRGTRRTLDGCQGEAALEKGLLSRDGWALYDDSGSVVFDPGDGWPLLRPSHQAQDWYFFGYGHDYKEALADYTKFGGPIPLMPRYTLGAWWSRYWAYSEQDLRELVGDFEAHDLPLDVLVIDMDWHTPHSWTGYTWNRALFPDPARFLGWVHSKGLRTTLNLHPAQGIQSFEEIYPAFAEAMGLDSESEETIPFRIANRAFVRNYFELIHHPMEDDGVDFWWIDWQQGETSDLEGLDPLPWLNQLHFADSTRRQGRPMIFSRWGGLGGHRYPMGFSGDTLVGWPALKFQPYFTASASNVAFGWWGHDIGGHMGDPTEPELYARWVQFGAMSPCMRLHSTNDPRAERRPWIYPDEVFQAAKAAFQWRYQLVPYLYTMARIAHETGVSLCRPMYYECPEQDGAYVARYQYFFGDKILAAPIVCPANPETGLATVDVWIPDGTWIDVVTKESFLGPRWVRLVGDLRRVPMLVKAGTILPLAAPFEDAISGHLASGTTDSLPRDRLILSVFPGDRGTFRLYEDDGLTVAHAEGEYEWTEFTTEIKTAETWEVSIAPVEGHCSALPTSRGYEIWLEGSLRPTRVLVDGQEASSWDYDPRLLRTTIQVPQRTKDQGIQVETSAPDGISALGTALNQQAMINDARALLGDEAPEGNSSAGGDTLAWFLDTVLHSDAQGRTDAVARLGGPLVQVLEYTTPEEAGRQLGRVIVGAAAADGEPFDLDLQWTLDRGAEQNRYSIHLRDVVESQILDAPFTLGCRVQTIDWSVEVQVTWRGESLTFSHQSAVLFPTIYRWHVLVCKQGDEPLPLESVFGKEGEISPLLPWQIYVQQIDQVRNAGEPHIVLFSTPHGEETDGARPKVAYLAATITSPDARKAILRFRAPGAVTPHLNGEKVMEAQVARDHEGSWLNETPRQTVEFHLRAGENSLVVRTQRPPGRRVRWYFSASLATPAGEPMIDLGYA